MASKSKPGASYVEDSFGPSIPDPKLNKGTMAIFGRMVDESKLPGGAKTVSVNQKTGYPGKE